MVEKKKIRVVSAAIEQEGRYLITQRKEGAVLPLLWEFPGGKVEPGESDADALERELLERLGAKASVAEHLSSTEREYAKYTVVLELYRCELLSGQEASAQAVNDLRWVSSDAFGDFAFTPADEDSMNALLGEELSVSS